MSHDRVDVIATTMSGSIQDWGKVKRIVPLFRDRGMDDVTLHVADSHVEARAQARDAVAAGGRVVISAGGSGTFAAVLEGCCDTGVPLAEIRLGFLRKGSADLIGKVLGMPDEVTAAIEVFVRAIREGHTMPCDVLEARSESGGMPPKHFVGYGGAEIFGRIPHYTENRFIKYYKGLLGQIFGDLGPFTTGMVLALLERLAKKPFLRARRWRIAVDGTEVAGGCFQALIVVNGYLGPDLPFTQEPLGSGAFYLFALRDLGIGKLLGQAQRARGGTIMQDPGRWGMETYAISDTLTLRPDGPMPFPVNVDGSTLPCTEAVVVRRVDQIRLLSRE
jgi:diacylglycerol kinase family enzyme